MSKLISIIAVPLSVLLALKYFKIYDASSIIPYDLALMGALFLVLSQVISHILVRVASGGTTFMGKLIMLVLALPGIIYLVNIKYPLSLGIDLEIIISLFLFTEGIYALH